MPQITWTLQGCLPNSPPGCCDGEGRDTGRTALRGWDPEAMKRAKAARLPANKGDLLAWPAPLGGAGGPCHPTATLLHRGRALQSRERTRGLTALHPAPSLLPKGPLLPGKSPSWWPRGVPGAVLGREEGGEMQRPNFHSPPWVLRCWRVLSKESAPKKRSVFQPGCIIWIKNAYLYSTSPPPQVRGRSKDYTLVFLLSQEPMALFGALNSIHNNHRSLRIF